MDVELYFQQGISILSSKWPQELCYSISAMKHYAAQRWEKWKLTLIRMMIPPHGGRQKAAFLPSSELHC